VAAGTAIKRNSLGCSCRPASYRWSSYGEAVGGGSKGNEKKAREGLVLACMSHEGAGFLNEAFAAARARFGPKRKDSARKLRGGGALAAGVLWSVRDLRVGV
jgi:hypothetical protein